MGIIPATLPKSAWTRHQKAVCAASLGVWRRKDLSAGGTAWLCQPAACCLLKLPATALIEVGEVVVGGEGGNTYHTGHRPLIDFLSEAAQWHWSMDLINRSQRPQSASTFDAGHPSPALSFVSFLFSSSSQLGIIINSFLLSQNLVYLIVR